MDNIVTLLQTYALKILISILIILIGFKIIKWIKKLVRNFLDKSNIDITLRPFIMSIIDIGLKVLIVLSAIQQAGIEATSFVAILGAASFAVGLAFQGALSNFAGGVLLLTLRVFKVGDFIEAADQTGKVDAINIFNTVLITMDNKIVTIPNGNLSNSTIINYTAKGTRRLDLEFGIGYEQDIDKVKQVLFDIINNHELILKNPEPTVVVSGQGDSAVFFTTRTWVLSSDYINLKFDLLEKTKKRFDEEGISIPYPQMDIHLHK
ncbi:MAG: mechanosensitive ion channel family protein [Halanaerobiales bacterium]